MTRLLLLSFCLIGFSEIDSQVKDNILPVELTYFLAAQDSNIVNLNWGTATETNNYGYDIERATTDNTFEIIGFITGHGNSFSPKDYSFIDTTLTENGLYYYRLKQIDTDGAIEYSDTVIVYFSYITSVQIESFPVRFRLFQNYPNPFNPVTNIDFDLPERGFVNLTIYNWNGEEVLPLLAEYQNAGHHSITLTINHLPSGVYFYKLALNIYGNIKYTASKGLLFLK